MNNGMYSVEDFGAVADYSEIAGGGAAKSFLHLFTDQRIGLIWNRYR